MRALRLTTLVPFVLCLAVACATDSDDDTGPARGAAGAEDTTGDTVAADVVTDGSTGAEDVLADDAAADGDATADGSGDDVADATDSDTADIGGDTATDATADAATDSAVADATDGDANTDTGTDSAIGPCIGPTEIVAVDAPEAGEPVADPTVPGSMHPNWRLTDFQPQSCGVGQTYGLDAFRGRTLVVVLLSAGCSYCLGQTVKLEQMRYQLEFEGHDVHFAVVNLKSMAGLQDNLIERSAFPLFQDTDEVDAWGLHGGRKDDFYIYDSDGVLRTFLPASGEVSTNLSTDEGYANVHDAIVAVVEGR